MHAISISSGQLFYVIFKIIVKRLRPLLPRIIDPSQVVFVPDKWISENVVLAQKVVRSFNLYGFKLDFHKTYDKLECEFI